MSRTTSPPILVWFRQDLRLADNPALLAACQTGAPVMPVYIWAPDEEGAWPPGAASRWWLHHSLASLQSRLNALGSRLILRTGPSLQTLRDLARQTGARAIYWNRRYEPAVIERDRTIKEALHADGLTVQSFNAALLHEPWTIQNKSGKPFQVFTPFWNHCLALPEPPPPQPAPKSLAGLPKWPASLSLEQFALLPRLNWADGFRASWNPGEAGAADGLDRFLARAASGYDVARDQPAIEGTSRLSPHLHFGEISPRQIRQAFKARNAGNDFTWMKSRFLAELGWREFAHHLLFHFPHTPAAPLRSEFARFRWRTNPAGLRAWQRGRTGYPIVDAGMRELWATGWMHNRVRMIVASFLVKDLLLSWEEGARWFWDTLVDADLAQNTLGWQWTAGCGADAAPFFRIFNPTSQGEKFDAQGTYVRRWVPELGRLPDDWIHQPQAAPAEVLARASVVPGKTYPAPIVSHAIAREVALEAFAKIKST